LFIKITSAPQGETLVCVCPLFNNFSNSIFICLNPSVLILYGVLDTSVAINSCNNGKSSILGLVHLAISYI
jgi:hypothetical protein